MKKGLKLLLCVDWEGLSLQEDNLQALIEFKKRWAIPFLHFMNPAYFTSKSLQERVEQVDFTPFVAGEDQWGLHLHGARHFVEACKVPFQNHSTFAKAGDQNPGEFIGHEVMLNSYSVADFEKMLLKSQEIFQNQGWPSPRLFRAGGWMMNPEYIPSLKKFGFWADCSAAPAEVLNNTGWQGEPLQRYLSILWGHLNVFSQPFLDQDFWQIPNNGGAIDYWKSDCEPLQWAHQLADETNPFAVITIHQETAAQHLPKLDLFLKSLNFSEEDQFLNKTKLMSSFLECSFS